MQEKARNEMVKAFEAELKELVRGLLEALMREERAMYLETHPTSTNGYYTRDLLTLVGPLEDLKAPVPATFTPRTNWSSWPRASAKIYY
jgi:hypothetical protein